MATPSAAEAGEASPEASRSKQSFALSSSVFSPVVRFLQADRMVSSVFGNCMGAAKRRRVSAERSAPRCCIFMSRFALRVVKHYDHAEQAQTIEEMIEAFLLLDAPLIGWQGYDKGMNDILTFLLVNVHAIRKRRSIRGSCQFRSISPNCRPLASTLCVKLKDSRIVFRTMSTLAFLVASTFLIASGALPYHAFDER